MNKTADRTGVDEYFAKLPKDRRAALARLRGTIRSVVPGATEVMSYGMPTFKLKGNTIVSIAAWTNFCSIYAVGYPILRRFAKELADYHTERSTLSFTPDAPIPDALVRKIVRARVSEVKRATAKAG